MMAYGQTAITEDLNAARAAAGAHIIDEAADVQPHDVTTDTPFVTFRSNGPPQRNVRASLSLWLAGHHV